MKEKKDIIVIGNVAYQRLPGTYIPYSKNNNTTKNENETVVDELRRIRLSKSIMERTKIRTGYKLCVYLSGKNIIIKKLKVGRSASKVNKMIIDNKYEIKLEINTLNFANYHKIATIDELGNVLIGHEILEKAGIVEKDILKICIKDDMIILIKKRKDNKKKRNFSNNRRWCKFRFYKAHTIKKLLYKILDNVVNELKNTNKLVFKKVYPFLHITHQE